MWCQARSGGVEPKVRVFQAVILARVGGQEEIEVVWVLILRVKFAGVVTS